MAYMTTRVLPALLLGALALSPALAQTLRRAGGVTAGTRGAQTAMRTRPAGERPDTRQLPVIYENRRTGGPAEALAAPGPRHRTVTAAAGAGEYPAIYGSVVYSPQWGSSGSQYGIYSLPVSDSQSFTLEVSATAAANNGAAVSNGIYYFNNYEVIMGILKLYTIFGVSLETGEVVYQTTGADTFFAP